MIADYEAFGSFTARKGGLTSLNIMILRSWLKKDFGIASVLVVERIGERNHVWLRLDGGPLVEAGWLHCLRRKRLASAVALAQITAEVERHCPLTGNVV